MKMISLDALRLHAGSIAVEHDLNLIIVFGSAATGIQHEKSDLDLAVHSSSGALSFEAMSELYRVFEERSGRAVSVVDIVRADPLLLSQIARHAIPLYGGNLEYSLFLLRAFHRYEDYRPYLKMERGAVSRWVRKHDES